MSMLSQLVEYLGMTRATANAAVNGIVEVGEPVVVLTVRPEPTINFHAHNIALTQPQAIRLLDDLHNLLAPILSNEQVAEWLLLLEDEAAERRINISS